VKFIFPYCCILLLFEKYESNIILIIKKEKENNKVSKYPFDIPIIKSYSYWNVLNVSANFNDLNNIIYHINPYR